MPSKAPHRHQGAASALAGKKAGIVLTYGDDDPFTSGAVNALRAFQDGFRYLEIEIAGYVYGKADRPGEVEGNPDLLARAYSLGQQLASVAEPIRRRISRIPTTTAARKLIKNLCVL